MGLLLAAQGAKVTPMEKVITLLKDLSAKVTAEGAKEAAAYDKFACFCKEQADEKLYNIEKSDAKIKDLSAEINELDTAINKLNSEISTLSKRISALDKEIADKTAKREKEHDVYLARAQDMNEAIDACKAAIDALKASKSEIADSGAKVNLVQLTKAVTKVLGSGAPKFEFQSNDIIATIEDLMATFKGMKKDLDFEEHDINSAFEKDKLGLSNEKKFKEKEQAEKEAIAEDKTERMNAAKEDRESESTDRNSDDTFLKELTKQCEDTAQLFDQRSKTRADELTALSEATTKLKEGAVDNFAANKKLVGLSQKSVTLSRASPVSFVQIKSVQHEAGKTAALEKVRSFLDDAAEHTGSRALSALAGRVTVSEDHFVKVRGLIKDLIQKLKDDAKAEASQKGFCDNGMAKAISKRDKASADIETATAKITTNTADKNAAEDTIALMEKEIAELKKGLNEATELRNDEKAENTKTEAMSEEGVQAVKDALSILSQFYSNAFVQTKKYTPPKADRDGNTVGDLAPEFTSDSYHGSQSESKGIIGILEVILSDFQRNKRATEKAEQDSQDAFDQFEKETKDDVDEKDRKKDKADQNRKDAEAAILEQEQALSDAKQLHESAMDELADLEEMCVKGEETWEERKAKREAEIEALKNALDILENWKD